MPINVPYHSSMEKEVKKAASIINDFFDSSLDGDKTIPCEFIRDCAGLAFLTVIKAGFIWSGKLGTGLVVSRLEDGGWSAPSAIGTAGVGFGAEIGGELIDFMIVLGSEAAVQTFKKGAQISVGAGLDVAIGPFGRAAAANVSAGKSGFSGNYSYSHAKGAFIGVGLRGSTILVRGDLNKKFYKRSDVTPMQILSGAVQPPSVGSCDVLYDAIRRAERGDSNYMQQQPMMPYRSSEPAYARQTSSSSSSGRLSDHAPYAASSYSSVEVNEDDPRLRRYSHQSQEELYKKFAAKKGQSNSSLQSSTTSASNSSNPPPAPAPYNPVMTRERAPTMPLPAQGGEAKVVFNQVLEFIAQRAPHADAKTFRDNCKMYGQDRISLDTYFGYLRSICTTQLLKELVPQLVRLLPTQEKREDVWNKYVHDILVIRE